MTELRRGVAGAALTLLLLATAIVSVRIAYGAHDDPYSVTASFPRAGQGLVLGSDVTLRGVPVGEVGSIELVDGQVDIRFDITDGEVRVPVDATATIRPKTLFGEKEVALAFEPNGNGPFVEDDGRLPDGAGQAGTEVEGLIDSTDILLSHIDADQLATVIFELSEASEGQGENIRRQFDSAVRLSQLLNDTLDAQLVALDKSAEFTGNLADLGDELNELNSEINRGLPTINAAFADYQAFLDTVPPFARELSSLLSVSRPNIHKMLDEGDNIMRVLLARQPELAETLEGLADYFYVFATGVGEEKFEDGSRFVYFVAFSPMQDINDLVCALFGSSPVPDFADIYDSLQENSAIDCTGAIAESSTSTPDGTAASSAGVPTLPEPGQRLLDQVGLDIATADQSQTVGVDSLLDRWLGEES